MATGNVTRPHRVSNDRPLRYPIGPGRGGSARDAPPHRPAPPCLPRLRGHRPEVAWNDRLLERVLRRHALAAWPERGFREERRLGVSHGGTWRQRRSDRHRVSALEAARPDLEVAWVSLRHPDARDSFAMLLGPGRPSVCSSTSTSGRSSCGRSKASRGGASTGTGGRASPRRWARRPSTSSCGWRGRGRGVGSRSSKAVTRA